MTTDNTRQDLILNAWQKIGCPNLNKEMIAILSQACGKTPIEIENEIKNIKNHD